MDNRNNLEGALIFGVLAVAIFILQVLFAVFVTVALMLTAAMSVVALLAILNDGLSINGDLVTPHEGKMFFLRGFIGVIALPIFLVIVFAILGEPIPFSPKWVWLAGFVFGSTGIEYLIYQDEQEKAQAAAMTVLPPLPEETYYLPPVMPTVEPVKPFRFASWEDEEPRR